VEYLTPRVVYSLKLALADAPDLPDSEKYIMCLVIRGSWRVLLSGKFRVILTVIMPIWPFRH